MEIPGKEFAVFCHIRGKSEFCADTFPVNWSRIFCDVFGRNGERLKAISRISWAIGVVIFFRGRPASSQGFSSLIFLSRDAISSQSEIKALSNLKFLSSSATFALNLKFFFGGRFSFVSAQSLATRATKFPKSFANSP